MGQEIERKFLLRDDSWRARSTDATACVQGYLASAESCSIRVRIAAERAWLNIKSATVGVARLEFEYEIPVADARVLIEQFCTGPLIKKTRYHVRHGEHLWEIDEFGGDNAGLVVAEIELTSPDEPFEHPSWLGEEVSADTRYYNVCLARRPFNTW